MSSDCWKKHWIPYCFALCLSPKSPCQFGPQRGEKFSWRTPSDENAVECAFVWVYVSACLLNEMKCETWKWAISRFSLSLCLCLCLCVLSPVFVLIEFNLVFGAHPQSTDRAIQMPRESIELPKVVKLFWNSNVNEANEDRSEPERAWNERKIRDENSVRPECEWVSECVVCVLGYAYKS